MKKLNIVILDFDDITNPLLNAGQARATYEVGRRLVQKGHSVKVLCSRFPGFKNRVEQGIEYKHIGLGSKNIRLNNLIYIATLPFVVPFTKADLFIECFTAPISTLFTPLFTKRPVVAVPTSFEADRFAKLYHLPFGLIEKFGLRFYKYFLPYTKYFDQKMKKANPKSMTKIVPEGVGEEYFAIKQKKPKHILFLGRFDVSQKGIDLLLESFAQIQKDVKLPLLIAGLGPDEEKVKSLIKKYNLANKVKIVGPAYGDKKFKLLSESLFVAFSSRHEGFSLFALEALASGNPLVSFDIPGLSWATDKAVLKAKPFNTDEYASLLRIASDEKKIAKYRAQARPFAKNFSWDKVASMQESFFYQVLKTEGRKSYLKKEAIA
jgi:glycogen synthase